MKVIYSFFMFFFLSAAAIAAPPLKTFGPEPNTLAKDPRFRMFAYDFLEHLKQWSSLYKLEKPEQKTEFIEAIQSSDGEEESVTEIHSSFGLDFEEAMIKQNAVDNDFYTLMLEFPEFQDVDDEETLKIIVDALRIVSKEEPTEMELNKVLPPGDSHEPGGLTAEEIWDCTLEALGMGVGSLISIHAIKKLAAEKGVQTVVVQMSKFLAKKAGWIGAIATLIDFGFCINAQSED
jgi:hypothetical protein